MFNLETERLTKKTIILAFGVTLIVGLAGWIIVRQTAEISRLREAVDAPRDDRIAFSELAAEDTRLSNQASQRGSPSALNEPTPELMRLRGEVGRLRSDLESLRQQKNDEIEKVRQDWKLRTDSLMQMYELNGIDANRIPNVTLGVTANDVVAKLRRVGANLLNNEEKFIEAEVFPATLSATNGTPVAVKLEFYFEDGKLVSRVDRPTP